MHAENHYDFQIREKRLELGLASQRLFIENEEEGKEYTMDVYYVSLWSILPEFQGKYTKPRTTARNREILCISEVRFFQPGTKHTRERPLE